MSEFTERELINMLDGLLAIRAKRDQYAKAFETGKKPIADYLAKHGGDLLDGENGIRAALQDKRGAPELDLMSMAEANEGLVLWAARQGVLKLDAKVFAALDGKARETLLLKDYISPGAGSQSLIIARTE